MLNDPFEDFGRWLETTGYEADFDANCWLYLRWWGEETKGERQTLTLGLTEESS